MPSSSSGENRWASEREYMRAGYRVKQRRDVKTQGSTNNDISAEIKFMNIMKEMKLIPSIARD